MLNFVKYLQGQMALTNGMRGLGFNTSSTERCIHFNKFNASPNGMPAQIIANHYMLIIFHSLVVISKLHFFLWAEYYFEVLGL